MDGNSIQNESVTCNKNVSVVPSSDGFEPKPTINYFVLVYQEMPPGILARWQLLQMAEKKKPPPIQRPQKPKALICSRRLFPSERSISRASHSNNNRELMIAELDDEDVDFDSVSQTSGLFTPFSSIADPIKINNLEQQLAVLQKQMAQLMAQQGISSLTTKLQQRSPPSRPPSSLPNKPTSAMGPPPPPPLLPSLREELLNRKKPSNSHVVADNNNKLNRVKSPISSPPLQQHQQGPTLVEVLKEMGKVKLKKVNRESPSGPMERSRKKLENDKTVAGILAKAMGDRRKKLKLDSDDMEEEDDQNQQLDKSSRPKSGGEGDWSDDEEEKENNNNIFMEMA